MVYFWFSEMNTRALAREVDISEAKMVELVSEFGRDFEMTVPVEDLGMNRVLRWIRSAQREQAKAIKVQAVYYFVSGKNQVMLAKEVGVTKATISAKANEFRDKFGISMPAGAAQQMRSDEQRETFSKVCKSNHQKRKQKLQSDSQEPQTTLTKNTGKQSGLRAKVLEMAKQPSLRPSSAGA